jgi:hypothetical protein
MIHSQCEYDRIYREARGLEAASKAWSGVPALFPGYRRLVGLWRKLREYDDRVLQIIPVPAGTLLVGKGKSVPVLALGLRRDGGAFPMVFDSAIGCARAVPSSWAPLGNEQAPWWDDADEFELIVPASTEARASAA